MEGKGGEGEGNERKAQKARKVLNFIAEVATATGWGENQRKKNKKEEKKRRKEGFESAWNLRTAIRDRRKSGTALDVGMDARRPRKTLQDADAAERRRQPCPGRARGRAGRGLLCSAPRGCA